MNGTRKPLVWLRGEVKTPPFSQAARVEAGVLLARLQRGELLGMPHSRPMPSIGRRCHELRVRDENKNWRIVYRIDSDAVVIAEVFEDDRPDAEIGDRRVPQGAGELRRGRARPRVGEGIMDKAKRERLEKAGYAVGDAADFLELTEEERRMVELRLAVGDAVRRLRKDRALSQKDLATRMGSTQARVAKIEAASGEVSLDLMFTGLFAAGGELADVGGAGRPGKSPASRRHSRASTGPSPRTAAASPDAAVKQPPAATRKKKGVAR